MMQNGGADPSQNLFYAGARNGSISAYDFRTKQTRQLIDGRDSLGAGGRIEGKYRHQARVARRCHRSSVIHLEVVREWQLLTSEMNGRVSLCVNAAHPQSVYYSCADDDVVWFTRCS